MSVNNIRLKTFYTMVSKVIIKECYAVPVYSGITNGRVLSKEFLYTSFRPPCEFWSLKSNLYETELLKNAVKSNFWKMCKRTFHVCQICSMSYCNSSSIYQIWTSVYIPQTSRTCESWCCISLVGQSIQVSGGKYFLRSLGSGFKSFLCQNLSMWTAVDLSVFIKRHTYLFLYYHNRRILL